MTCGGHGTWVTSCLGHESRCQHQSQMTVPRPQLPHEPTTIHKHQGFMLPSAEHFHAMLIHGMRGLSGPTTHVHLVNMEHKMVCATDSHGIRTILQRFKPPSKFLTV